MQNDDKVRTYISYVKYINFSWTTVAGAGRPFASKRNKKKKYEAVKTLTLLFRRVRLLYLIIRSNATHFYGSVVDRVAAFSGAGALLVKILVFLPVVVQGFHIHFVCKRESACQSLSREIYTAAERVYTECCRFRIFARVAARMSAIDANPKFWGLRALVAYDVPIIILHHRRGSWHGIPVRGIHLFISH